ncbi:MAG: hypothetical protein FK730_15315 [Asgard group archaeon]|nr:hypothetical protein [Asgard group archaeon]
MSVDKDKWSEIVSVTLVFIQETLDELLLLQMNESKIRNFFSQMYFNISREDETEETVALLEKINLFRKNNHRIFVSTLDFLIAPLHSQIETLNQIIDDPSIESKKKLINAFNVHARSELFVKQLYHDEHEIITEYLAYKNKHLQSFKEEKLRLEKYIRKTNDDKIESLRKALFEIKL